MPWQPTTRFVIRTGHYDGRHGPVRRILARRQRRWRQPQDGGGGQGARRCWILKRANDFGQRQRPAGEPRRRGVGAEEGRSGAARRVRIRRLGTRLRHTNDCPDLQGLPVRARGRGSPLLRHLRHRREGARRTRCARQGCRARREDQTGYGCHLLAGAQDRHAGHHDREDHGQEALQVLDNHSQSAHRRQGSAMTSAPTAKADGTVLTGVSETALLTLRVRANEARRPDSIIDDPMAIELADAIDYDFAKFGFSRRQDMAGGGLAYGRDTPRYLVDHPRDTVVALADGLQTSFYRLDAAGVGDQFQWLTVDLPPMIELRRKLLPASA